MLVGPARQIANVSPAGVSVRLKNKNDEKVSVMIKMNREVDGVEYGKVSLCSSRV